MENRKARETWSTAMMEARDVPLISEHDHPLLTVGTAG